jgi:hypothetical protein
MSSKIAIVTGGLVRDNQQINCFIAGQTEHWAGSDCPMTSAVSLRRGYRKTIAGSMRNRSKHPAACSFNK